MKKILKFSSKTCGPCKMMATQLEKADLGVPIEEIDIQESDLSKQFDIRTVPTLVFMVDDTEVHRTVGVRSVSQIEDILLNYF